MMSLFKIAPVFLALCLVTFLPAHSGAADELTAQAIVDKMVGGDSLAFENGQATIRLTIMNKKGKKRERELTSVGKKIDGLTRFLMTFDAPEDVAGTQMLSIERKGEDDLQYLYLPAMKDKRRIAGGAKNESFMGTDFTYADMENKDVEDGKYTRLPDETVSGIEAFRIDSIPEDGDTQYSKIELWIDRKDFLPLKIYFYDRHEKLVKKLISQRIEPKDGKMTVTRLMMKNVQKGTKTILEIVEMKRNIELPDGLFEPSNMGK
jgi:outer membrane lipoprotein-sorting protein